MSRKAPYARIAITLPQHDLSAADELAREQDRSRSWIIAEAVRQYVARSRGAVARPGLGKLRHAQLVADLKLSPEARVRAAEETARVSPSLRPVRAQRVIGFDRYEDFLDWKRSEAAGGA